MDIKELQTCKRDTEIRIREFIRHEKHVFEEVAGTNISSIQFNFREVSSIGVYPTLTLNDVKIKVDL